MWIEIPGHGEPGPQHGVTPLAGVWIEMCHPPKYSLPSGCHPPRGGVDRNKIAAEAHGLIVVTPLAGVWIEIWNRFNVKFQPCVTPLAGVWIEIPAASPR